MHYYEAVTEVPAEGAVVVNNHAGERVYLVRLAEPPCLSQPGDCLVFGGALSELVMHPDLDPSGKVILAVDPPLDPLGRERPLSEASLAVDLQLSKQKKSADDDDDDDDDAKDDPIAQRPRYLTQERLSYRQAFCGKHDVAMMAVLYREGRVRAPERPNPETGRPTVSTRHADMRAVRRDRLAAHRRAFAERSDYRIPFVRLSIRSDPRWMFDVPYTHIAALQTLRPILAAPAEAIGPEQTTLQIDLSDFTPATLLSVVAYCAWRSLTHNGRPDAPEFRLLQGLPLLQTLDRAAFLEAGTTAGSNIPALKPLVSLF